MFILIDGLNNERVLVNITRVSKVFAPSLHGIEKQQQELFRVEQLAETMRSHKPSNDELADAKMQMVDEQITDMRKSIEKAQQTKTVLSMAGDDGSICSVESFESIVNKITIAAAK